MKYLLSFVVMTLVACTTAQVREKGQEGFLFPDGRYQQDVEVVVSIPKEERDFDFSAIVQKTPEEFIFYGYNGFGISLFKIREKSGQVVEMESGIDQIQQHKDFFLKIFSLVKTIIQLEKKDPRWQGSKIHLGVDGIEADVELFDRDNLGIPQKMVVETKGQYRVEIKTTSYKLQLEKPKTDTGPH